MKQLIQLAYMHEENGNYEKIDDINNQIVNQLNNNKILTILNNEKFIKIPHGNDNNYIIAILTDISEVQKAKEYFDFNEVPYTEEKEVLIKDFEKIIKEDPNFLGFNINISNLSYFLDKNLFL